MKCSACGQKISVELQLARKKTKSQRIKKAFASLKKQGFHIGRPKKRNDFEIQSLRKKGMTIRAIATNQGISTFCVLAALKEIKGLK